MAQVKRIRRNVSGIILLDKPLGFTSNAALQKVRWLLNAEKAGHTGSLDPLASGVLPLCFGEATKFSQYLLDSDKGYETLMQLGKTTTTADAEGEVLQTRPVTVGRADIEAVLPNFRGQISQIPPMYSALKRDGQPLYKLARAGEVVEREPRSVTITRLELLASEGDTARLAVDCTKGTYIRTLVEDIGEQLGCGAYVAELRRTHAGPFSLAQTVTLEELEAVHAEGGNEAVDRFLMPSDSGLLDWPLLHFSEASSFYWLNGQPVRAPDAPKFGMVRVQDHNGRFIGIGEELGCGAYVAELRRTQAGPFSLAQTVTLEELEAVHAEGGNEAVDRFLMPSDSGLLDWPLLHFSEHSAFYWLNGQPVRAPDAPKFGMVRVQDHNGRFIGIGEVSEDGRIAPRRLIRSE